MTGSMGVLKPVRTGNSRSRQSGSPVKLRYVRDENGQFTVAKPVAAVVVMLTRQQLRAEARKALKAGRGAVVQADGGAHV